MSAHCNTRSCSPLKTVVGSHHGGGGCPMDRGLDILTEDPEHADINNESTHSSDAIFALGGPESIGHPEDPV